MNFSHVYEEERFYEHEKVRWIDCTEIPSTDCYCDEEAEDEIRKRIETLPVEGVHFIDSGNYHYVTKFWIEKIKKPFTLVVFDHHSDMEKPLFGDILSCGSWIMDVLEHNSFVQKVILIGISKGQVSYIDQRYCDKLIYIEEEEIRRQTFWTKLGNIHETYPLYISVDKDVLSEYVIRTNWSQGEMASWELKKILHILLKKCQVIGMDICGECTLPLDTLSDVKNNSRFNENLIKFLEVEEEQTFCYNKVENIENNK